MHLLTRRRFLGLTSASVLGGMFPRLGLAGDPPEIRISLLHTTDLHGNILPTANYDGEPDLGGLARCASQIRTWRHENPASLLLDAGDVFQGTEVGLRTRGKIMTRCFQALGYDTWVVGNHEFDWGMEPFCGVLEDSVMPVLCANCRVDGALPGTLQSGPFAKIRPWLIKEVGGFRIGMIGLTTPGLPYWFQPEFTKGFEVGDPVPAALQAAGELRDAGVDATVLVVHMGPRPRGDDFANRLDALAAALPGVAVMVSGHTHREISAVQIGAVPCTQAAYFGIFAGRIDLVFSRENRRLLRVEPMLKKMDASIPMDPGILSLAADDLEQSSRVMETRAGVLSEPLSIHAPPGVPSDAERLVAVAVKEALHEKGLPVDAVLHGLFVDEDIPAGPKTIADLWKILPYENYVITGWLTSAELGEILSEMPMTGRRRGPSLAGLTVLVEERGGKTVAAGVLDSKGKQPASSQRFLVAMNTYDAAGAGQRMMKLREIMMRPEVRREIQTVQTREALITFFAKHGDAGVGPGSLKFRG